MRLDKFQQVADESKDITQVKHVEVFYYGSVKTSSDDNGYWSYPKSGKVCKENKPYSYMSLNLDRYNKENVYDVRKPLLTKELEEYRSKARVVFQQNVGNKTMKAVLDEIISTKKDFMVLLVTGKILSFFPQTKMLGSVFATSGKLEKAYDRYKTNNGSVMNIDSNNKTGKSRIQLGGNIGLGLKFNLKLTF